MFWKREGECSSCNLEGREKCQETEPVLEERGEGTDGKRWHHLRST